jgi:uncharacterized protein (TIGR00251 family)
MESGTELAVLQSTSDGVILNVRVIPRAGKAGVAGLRGDALLVRLTAPPVEGAANAELIEVLADAFKMPKRAVAIVGGERSRTKRVRLQGIEASTVRSRIERLVAQ